MPYLGNTTRKASDIRRFDVTGSTSATHTLTWTAPNEQSLIVTINGVKQHEDAYSVSGTTLTLTSALISTDKLEVIGINDIGTTITPAEGSVTNDHISTSAAIAKTKLASLDIVNADVNASAAIATSKISGLATSATTDTTDASNISSGTLPVDRVPYVTGRNRIINGNFDVWQRGTSFAGQTATAYFADRWEVAPATGCTMTVSRQAFTAGQTDVPNEPSYFLRADITTAGSANAEITNRIEDVRTLAGETIMVSFYAKSTAGTPTLNCRIHQDFGSGGSSRVTSGVTTKVLSSSWQKFTFSLTLGSISGKTIGTSSYIAFNFYWDNSSTSNDVDLAQVQLEAGSVATPFEHETFGETLSKCKRYYSKSYDADTTPGSSGAGGSLSGLAIYSSGSQGLGARWPVAMRTSPTVVLYSTGGTSGNVTATSNNANIAASAGSTGANGFEYVSGSLPNTAANGYRFHFTADAEL